MAAVRGTKDATRQSLATGARKELLLGIELQEWRIDAGGVDTSVLEYGNGPPLLLLHGGIECGGVYWTPVITALGRSHHLVMPDVPGLGESAPVERLDVDAFSDWLQAIIDLTCEQEPIVVAHSLLGTMAARFAARHGNVLDRLVVYSAPGVGAYHMPLGLRLAATLFALRPTESNAESFERWAFADYNSARERAGKWLSAFSEYTRQQAMVHHVKRTMRQLIGSCTKRVPDEDLRKIDIPTALVWGRQDRFVPVELG
jgi:2-hydroxymuconate-semialdehyde hydrolase